MYRCMVTGQLSRLGTKLNKIVVERRDKIYTRWVRNEETNQWEEVFVAKGWEIVREINASDNGVKLWDSWTDDQRKVFLKHSIF